MTLVVIFWLAGAVGTYGAILSIVSSGRKQGHEPGRFLLPFR